jgi:3-phenylpropionate/trans-cinnamate dioxygenase ferredoxin component
MPELYSQGMKPIGTLSDFPLNEQKIIDLEDEFVLVLRTESGFWAIEDRCSHDDNELFGGEVVGKEIKCPRHGARFDLESGQALCLPAVRAVRTYQVVVNDQNVFLQPRD